MNTAIIQARMNSKRFPSKIFADLCGKPVLQHVIERVNEVKSIDRVIVATCYGGGGAVKVFCDKIGVECFIHDGKESDVLSRFVACSKLNPRPEFILRVCADNPLFDAQAADVLFAELLKSKADYCGYEINGEPAITIGTGYFGEVFTLDAMERLDRFLNYGIEEREHVTMGFYTNLHKFSCNFVKAPRWYRKEKLKNAAIDTPDDLARVRRSMEVTV